MVACCALWGGNAVAVKFASPAIPPLGVAACRFLFSVPILAAICWAAGQPVRVPFRHWRLLLGHGLISAVQIGSFNWGTSHSEAGRSSIFINIHPLIVAPLAWVVLGERMGRMGLAGLVSAAAGVALVLSSSFRGSRGNLGGDMVVIASGAVFAIQTILQKLTFPTIPPATLLFNQTVVALPVMLAVSGLVEGFATYQFTVESVAAVVFQGVAVSGFCFSIWLLLLGRYPATQLATAAFLTPMFGVGLGLWLRHEPLTGPLVVGGLLVGLGILLTSTDRAGHVPPANDVALPGEDAA